MVSSLLNGNRNGPQLSADCGPPATSCGPQTLVLLSPVAPLAEVGRGGAADQVAAVLSFPSDKAAHQRAAEAVVFARPGRPSRQRTAGLPGPLPSLRHLRQRQPADHGLSTGRRVSQPHRQSGIWLEAKVAGVQ